MAEVSVSMLADRAALQAMLRAPWGMVSTDLQRRGQRVLSAARRNAPVDTGRLRSSLRMEVTSTSGPPAVRIVTNVPYAVYQEYGTGVYAGRGYIYPKRGKYLVFKGRGGKLVFARRVKGVPATHFLERALPEASR